MNRTGGLGTFVLPMSIRAIGAARPDPGTASTPEGTVHP